MQIISWVYNAGTDVSRSDVVIIIPLIQNVQLKFYTFK